MTNEDKLLSRIVVNPSIFGGKPIIRGRRLAVEHILGMLAAGDSADVILQGYSWLEAEDIQACLIYANRLVSHERIEFIVAGAIRKYCWTHAFPGTARQGRCGAVRRMTLYLCGS